MALNFIDRIRDWYGSKKDEKKNVGFYESQKGTETPVKTIERDSRPGLENHYIHIPRLGLFEASKNRERDSVEIDEKKTKELLKRYNLKQYSSLHTHPRFGELSVEDIKLFVLNSKLTAEHIAIREDITGKVIGTYTIKRTKKTPNRINGYDAREYFNNLEKNSPNSQGVDEAIKKYHLKTRFTYNFDKRQNNSETSKEGLEGKVSAFVGIMGLIGGIFFLSSNITGNVISNYNIPNYNIIGVILILIGILGVFVYFRKKK